MHNSFYRKVGAFLSALVLSLVSASLWAQGPEGRLAGVVHDPSGAVIPNAKVTVTNTGTAVKHETKTGGEGAFSVPSLAAGEYSVQVEATGFSQTVYNHVKIDTARETSLTVVMEVGKSTQTVEVVAGQEVINTTTAEVTQTLETSQIRDLPLNGRAVIGLLGATQANVDTTNNKVGLTSLSGSLPSWSQVTLEGINIQDIFIRTNALDFIPNRPTTEAVEEFTVTQGAQGANAALGANGVSMIVKSGTNAFHGTAYEFNRNSAFAANTWFNNHSTPVVKIPFLNRNEYGVNIGGPVIKNKLFFFGDYEAFRNHTAAGLNNTIPAHDDYLQGNFRYIGLDGQPHMLNVMNGVAGKVLGIDPLIQSAFLARVPSASNVNNFNVGNSSTTQLLNTAGWLRNQSANTDRDIWLGKVDYEVTSRHHVNFTFEHLHETTLRNDLDPINLIPKITNNNVSRLFSGGWRWTITDNLVNSFRTGANYSQAPFDSSYKNVDGFLFAGGTSSASTVTGIGLTDTQVFFQPQGRIPTIHQYMDDVSWVKGNHSFKFGGQFQKYNVDSYDFGINPYLIPIVNTGFAPGVPVPALVNGDFPGGTNNLGAANALRAFLGGLINSDVQQFYVRSKTSGFVPGARNDRNLTLNDFMLYAQDTWRMRSNLTVTLGLKWEYLSPYKEINGLQLGPVWADKNNPGATLLNPNATIDFLNQAYNADTNNFGPTIGIAWDPFNDGKTSIRAGYSMVFVNDDTFRAAGNASDGNFGLGSAFTNTLAYPPQTTTVTFGSGIPAIPTPTFKVPRTLADQLAVSNTAAVFGINPHIRVPHVHELAFGVQRQIMKQTSFEVRYVGTLGRDLIRGIDLNQTNAGINQPFLTDFINARNNGYLALAQPGGTFNPAYNPAIPGSQPLTFFPTINGLMTQLTSPNLVPLMQQNAAAEYANFLVSNPARFNNARNVFLPNPGIYAADLIQNNASSSYHSLVAEVIRRFGNGLEFQANYTFSKLLTNSPNDSGQTRFDAFLDNARPRLEKALSDFDIQHAVKVNAIYDLPFGRGKMFASGASGVIDRLIGGWQLSGIYTIQSGNHFSIISNRGTFNRAGRSTGVQGAVSSLSEGAIQSHMKFVMLPNGNVYWIDPSLIDSGTTGTGLGVGPDNQFNTGSTTFNQVFFNPLPGQVGNLGLNAFTGPMFTNLDMGLAKNTKITEGITLQIRLDAFNMPNHPVFFIGNQEVNSSTFGRITATNNTARRLQIAARLTF
jgi:hypothetical protein